jgi:ketopantoate reductase
MSIVAVVGVGAVGGAVAARLWAKGRDDVLLCVRTRFDELVVEGPAGILQATPCYECILVGRAEGAVLDEGLVEEIVTSMVLSPAEAGTSMLTDRRAGRLLEADARNGAVVRIGARHGIKTPLNRALAALLNAIHQDV